MSKTITANAAALTVETTDELTLAIAAAHARVSEVYAAGSVTLIDTISNKDWLEWDGQHENAIVADSDGLEVADEEEALPVAA